MAVDKNGSKTDAAVKLVLVFFVCLLSFTIGTYVGQKYAERKFNLSKFEGESHESREVASVHPDSTEVKPKDALSDDEVAKLAEEFVADEGSSHGAKEGEEKEGHPTVDKNEGGSHSAKNEEHGAEHEAPPAKEHAKVAKAPASEHHEEPAEEHGTKAAPMKAAEKVAHGESPEEKAPEHHKTPEKARIPQSLPREIASSPVGKYTVQIAAYTEEGEAKKMVTQLKGQAFQAFYVTAKVKDPKTKAEKTYYRVSVGLFNSQKEADTYKTELVNSAKVSSAFVQKITE